MTSYISSIGTAVPGVGISQSQIASFMLRHLDLDEHQEKQLRLIYRASGIQTRYSVIEDYGKEIDDFTFFPRNERLEPFPTVGTRMALFQEKALDLCHQAALDCLSGKKESITHLITVSCTGMYAPGIDIELIERLDLPRSISRTAINFMGCYAAFNALKIADQFVRNDPSAKVLIVTVELCSIHLLKSTHPDGLLSNALFGDGAAAVLVTGRREEQLQLGLETFYADLEIAGKEAMAWRIDDFGFEMKLSSEVPEVIRSGIRQLTDRLLSSLDAQLADVSYFAIHPGGKRILEVIEEELGINREQNQPAYKVMRDYGNMSSSTVLFVIKQLMSTLKKEDAGKRVLSFAFGPGLTLESMLLKIY